jgi:septal ring factor EnvC (AmiA/AmiB activator)
MGGTGAAAEPTPRSEDVSGAKRSPAQPTPRSKGESGASKARAAGGARETLKAVGDELEQEQLDIERLESEEESLLDAVDAAEKSQAEAERAAARAEVLRSKTAAELVDAQARERAAQAEADVRLQGFGPRLRVWQRLSPERQASLLLGAGSAQEALARQRLFRSILGGQLEEVRDVLRALQVAKADRASSMAISEQLPKIERESQAARAEAKAQEMKHEALLDAVHDERKLHERAMAELQSAQAGLSATLVALPAKKMPSTGFGRLKGRLPRPVAGPIEVGFGDILNPRFHTVTLQKGVDIRAPEGTPVRAQHAGRVVHAGWFKGYGNLVIVDHGDGFYALFAHLATLGKQVDDPVATGDELGTVGSTGSLKGPYLYFEIRKHGQPLDPAAWLMP